MSTAQRDDRDRQYARARKWRWLTVWSGFLLAPAFFMPAVRVWETIVPAGLAADAAAALDDYRNSWLDTVLSVLAPALFLLAPYPLGAIIAIGSAARLARRQHFVRVSAVALVALIATTNLLVTLAILVGVAREGLPSWSSIIDAWQFYPPFMIVMYLCAPIVLVYLLFTVRLRPRAHFCHVFVASLSAFVWFACWSVLAVGTRDVLYGLHLSVLASFVLLVAVVGEAGVTTGRSWLPTFGQLLTCRLRDAPGVENACPGCGYNLFGLTELRCPECGRPFTFAELGTTADALGFESGSKDGDR